MIFEFCLEKEYKAPPPANRYGNYIQQNLLKASLRKHVFRSTMMKQAIVSSSVLENKKKMNVKSCVC